MADAYDQVFAEIGVSGYSPTPTPYPSEPITTGEVSKDPYDSVIASILEEEKPKEAGIWAHLKKGLADSFDYIGLTKAGFGATSGLMDVDEEEIIKRIGDIRERQRNI